MADTLKYRSRNELGHITECATEDPTECVDCDACVPECPVEAIFFEDNVPAEWREFIALNAEMAATCPPIVTRNEPLAKP